MGEFSGPLDYERSYARKEESGLVLLPIFDRREVSLHVDAGVV